MCWRAILCGFRNCSRFQRTTIEGFVTGFRNGTELFCSWCFPNIRFLVFRFPGRNLFELYVPTPNLSTLIFYPSNNNSEAKHAKAEHQGSIRLDLLYLIGFMISTLPHGYAGEDCWEIGTHILPSTLYLSNFVYDSVVFRTFQSPSPQTKTHTTWFWDHLPFSWTVFYVYDNRKTCFASCEKWSQILYWMLLSRGASQS